MTNITTTVASAFIPEIWARRALELLQANIVMARLVRRHTDFEPAFRGKTLNIPIPGTFTAQDKAADTPISPQAPTGGGLASVTLNRHKAVDFLVEDVARAQAAMELLDTYLEPAVMALVQAIESDLFSAAASASGVASVGTAGTDVTPDLIRQARKILNDNKIPLTNRFLVLSPKDEMALVADSSLATYFANADPNAVREGRLGRLYGFDLFMSQLVPVVAGTPPETRNLAFHRDAIVIAFGALPTDVPGVKAATLNDPSGIPIRVMAAYDVSHRGVRIGIDVLYGVAVVRPQGIVLVKA